MTVTSAEQYLIELINRARLDPQAEADRYLSGDLNANNSGLSLTAESRQPLAGNQALNAAASAHSIHMINVDEFAHEGIGDGTPTSRMGEAGYIFSGSWATGENISVRGSTGTINLDTQIESHHSGLFISVGHRLNILSDSFREIGVGQEAGVFSGFSTPGNYNVSMLTENFAKSGSNIFITGVVYNDTDNNDFYSIGEGLNNNVISVSGIGSATSATAGGYAVNFGGVAGARTVTSGSMSVSVITGSSNIKLDFVGGYHVDASASLTLNSGVTSARLLGTDNTDLTGSNASENLIGNVGNNRFLDGGGNDTVVLGSGNDFVEVGGGVDSFDGGAGRDYISYVFSPNGVTIDLQANTVSRSWAADDTINGFESVSGSRTGNDQIFGTDGANVIRTFGGRDRVYDRGGNDIVDLGGGNDFAQVGDGADWFDGGAGVDYISYAQSIGGVTIDLVTNTTSGGWAGNDTIVGFERVAGSSSGNDFLYGTDGENLFRGLGGDDEIYGRGDSDKLYGGNGNDFLDGGSGDDFLSGGNGIDTFHFQSTGGNDTVNDFSDDIDVIEFASFTYLSNAESALNYASQQGGDVLFDFGVDGSLLVENILLSQLSNDVNIV